MPYLQPLALSAATRTGARRSRRCRSSAARIAEATAREPVPLERLVRVRPRTLVMIATLTGAFYVLLPQLANVDDSFAALGSANWGWLAGAVVMSAFTYVAAAIGMIGGVRERLPFVPDAAGRPGVVVRQPGHPGQRRRHGAQRALHAEGRDPAGRGGHRRRAQRRRRRHRPRRAARRLLRLGGPGRRGRVLGPGGSKLLVVIAVVLAVVGVVLATRRGRRLRARPRRAVRAPVAARASRRVARSPARLAALFGGSIGVTLAYIAALACAVAAFDGGLSFAQVGAVYLGASLIAAAAPTPGGLGALEAALVAGLHRRRHGAGDRRRRRAELPAAHVLAADPARLALLPPPRPPQLHLTELTL